jgi:hypothetical protein
VFHSCQKASRCYADGIGILVASCYNLLCSLLFLLGHCVKSEQRPRQRGAGNSGNLLYWSLLSPNFYWPSVVLRCFERRCSFVSQKVCQKVCILACNCLQVSGMFPSLQQEIFSQTLGSGGTLRCKIGAQLLVSICSLVPLYRKAMIMATGNGFLILEGLSCFYFIISKSLIFIFRSYVVCVCVWGGGLCSLRGLFMVPRCAKLFPPTDLKYASQGFKCVLSPVLIQCIGLSISLGVVDS